MPRRTTASSASGRRCPARDDDERLTLPLAAHQARPRAAVSLGRSAGMSDVERYRSAGPAPPPACRAAEARAPPRLRGPGSDIRPRPRRDACAGAVRRDHCPTGSPLPALELEPEERAVEVAQKRGIFRRSLVSWGGPVLVGAGRPRLSRTRACGSPGTRSTNLFARFQATLGDVGLAFAGNRAAGAPRDRGAREMMAIGRQRHIARLHQDFAKAHAGDDLNAWRASSSPISPPSTRSAPRDGAGAQGRYHRADGGRSSTGATLSRLPSARWSRPLDEQRQGGRSPPPPSASPSSRQSRRAPSSTSPSCSSRRCG